MKIHTSPHKNSRVIKAFKNVMALSIHLKERGSKKIESNLIKNSKNRWEIQILYQIINKNTQLINPKMRNFFRMLTIKCKSQVYSQTVTIDDYWREPSTLSGNMRKWIYRLWFRQVFKILVTLSNQPTTLPDINIQQVYRFPHEERWLLYWLKNLGSANTEALTHILRYWLFQGCHQLTKHNDSLHILRFKYYKSII